MSKVIEITDTARQYLLNNLTKILDNKDKFPESVAVDFGPHLESLIEQLQMDVITSLSLNKKQARLFQVFLDMAKNSLEKNIIPGYIQRMITPASKKKFSPYVKAAKEKRDMIKNLLEQL